MAGAGRGRRRGTVSARQQVMSHPRIFLFAVFALVASWSLPGRAQPASVHWESAATAPPGCDETLAGDPALDQALRSLTVRVGGAPHPLAAVRLEGLATLPEPEL